MEQLYPTRKLTWPEAANLAQKRVEEILHKEVSCQMALEDETYWTLYSPTYMFSTKELELLLQAGRATKEVWEEAIPQEENASRSLGMELTRLLLKQALHGQWSQEHCTEEALWLLDYCSCGAQKPALRLPGVWVDLEELKSQKELLDYLEKHGPTHSSLMDFCEEYREKYHNDLCWPYPISDGNHMGTFFVPVQEGTLSLPYDRVEREDYEVFTLEDTALCNATSMEVFLEDWDSFSGQLRQAMENMAWALRHLEQKSRRNHNGP